MPSAETQAILDAYEQYKKENEEVKREDKEKLKEQMAKEEEKAKKKLDKKVREDQEKEKKWDKWVRDNKNKKKGEKVPPVVIDGRTWNWSGNDPAAVRDPNAPNTFTGKVAEVLEKVREDNERIEQDREEVIEKIRVNTAIQAQINAQIENAKQIAAEGAITTVAKYTEAKANLAELRKRMTDMMWEANDFKTECIATHPKRKSRGKRKRAYIHWNNVVSGKITSRQKQTIALAECSKRMFDKYTEKAQALNEQIKELNTLVIAAWKWIAPLQAQQLWLERRLKDDYYTRAEQAEIQNRIVDMNSQIVAALKAGASHSSALITDLNKMRVAILQRIQDQEKQDLQVVTVREQDEHAQLTQEQQDQTSDLGAAIGAAIGSNLATLGEGLNFEGLAPALAESQAANNAALIDGLKGALLPNAENLKAFMLEAMKVQDEIAAERLAGRVGAR